MKRLATDKIDNFYIEQAHKYTCESGHTTGDASEIKIEKGGGYSFKAIFKQNFPSSITEDISPYGVKREEEVTFVFYGNFPYTRPLIFLRDDFPKTFAHINPLPGKVNPCVFDGKMEELVHQPKFFDGVLDQVADWLDKAVTNNLIDEDQGWEPMRTDISDGKMLYRESEYKDIFQKLSSEKPLLFGAFYDKGENSIDATFVTFDEKVLDNTSHTFCLIFKSKQTDGKYYPNDISNFKELVVFANKVGIANINRYVCEYAQKVPDKDNGTPIIDLYFITLFVKRSAKLIGQDSDIEIFNFAVQAKFNKDKVPYEKARVFFLSTLEMPSTNLLKRFSGIGQEVGSEPMVVQIGCGSLGSKIITHIARTGITNSIHLVDNGKFSAHNHARHTLMFPDNIPLNPYKSEVLKNALITMGLLSVTNSTDNITMEAELLENAIIIDSTANISVRNYLINNAKQEVIYTVLHNSSNIGLMCIESKNKDIRVDDMMAYFYMLCYGDEELREAITTTKANYESIGQGCGSFTTKITDAKISLVAASMATSIQNRLIHKLNTYGEILVGRVKDDISIIWESYNVEAPKILDDSSAGMQIRVLAHVVEKMALETEKYKPLETGGGLVGHISLINNTIYIIDTIEAPEDSIRETGYFELGTQGLKKKVRDYEGKTNGLLTYLGTWHSHPQGGGPSNKDNNTKKDMIKIRKSNYTVMLIYSKEQILLV